MYTILHSLAVEWAFHLDNFDYNIIFTFFFWKIPQENFYSNSKQNGARPTFKHSMPHSWDGMAFIHLPAAPYHLSDHLRYITVFGLLYISLHNSIHSELYSSRELQNMWMLLKYEWTNQQIYENHIFNSGWMQIS